MTLKLVRVAAKKAKQINCPAAFQYEISVMPFVITTHATATDTDADMDNDVCIRTQ